MICKTKTTAPSIYYANDSNKKQPVDIKLNKPEKEMQSAASIVEANNQIVSAKGTTIPTAPASENPPDEKNDAYLIYPRI